MNLANYSNCQSVPEYFNITFTEFYKQQSINQQNDSKLDNHLSQELVQQIKISPKLIEYILKICEQKQFDYLTKNNTLLMIQKYVKSRNIQFEDDIQLVCLVCLNISQKVFMICDPSYLKDENLNLMT